MKILSIIVLAIACLPRVISADCHEAHSIYVPRQLSYNPILENALIYSKKNSSQSWDYLFSVKPIYTQTVGKSLKKYFSINHKPCMQVQENGTGDIDSLWLQVVSSNSTYYSSMLAFKPVSKTGGALLFFQADLPHDLSLSIDTALIYVNNNIHIGESLSKNLGTSAFLTVKQSLASNINCFGRICGSQGKSGLDDIQVKLIRTIGDSEKHHVDVYGLLGIPTCIGSRARYLFEPLVGSRHAQLGLGMSGRREVYEGECNALSFQGEVKWRYGFEGKENRSFDLKNNGQWSRYMLLVQQTALYTVYPAINTLTFNASVTPRNSVDVYLAAHLKHQAWNFELGYDYWYRSAEKICIKNCNAVLNKYGIADLLGIAQLNPHTASTANISQSVAAGANQMVSDATFVPLKTSDVNLCSGAAPQSSSNSVYASIGYDYDCHNHPMEFGINFSYEKGTNTNKPDTLSGWVSFDIYI